MTPAGSFPMAGGLRVAVVVQRYGLEVNGGAELHARHFVEVLRELHHVTVLTSCALDYTLWDSHYPAGPCEVAGVPVLRFAHPPSGALGRARVPRRQVMRYRLRKLWHLLDRPAVAPLGPEGDPQGESYLRAQGPFCAGLIEHLRHAADSYHTVLFFTARFYPTAAGIRACTAPAILVPTLHDERSMYLPLFHRVFRSAASILWNCGAERELAHQLYGAGLSTGHVCGDAVNVPPGPTDPLACQAVRARHGLLKPYFVFVGRVSRSKGFGTLARAFAQLRRQHATPVELVVIGQSFMPQLPQVPGIRYVGFVDEAERDALISAAVATVVTSRHESLSLVTLESLALGVPVVVNAASGVLRHHVQQSGAGRSFGPGLSLPAAMVEMLTLPEVERRKMGEAGRNYVRQHYSADRVRTTLLEAVASAARMASLARSTTV